MQDVEIGGVLIFVNFNILLIMGFVNCDDSVFSELDCFDICCLNVCNYLFFGYGIYFCFGQ